MCVTETKTAVPLTSVSLHSCQKIQSTPITIGKLPLLVKEYIYFYTDGKTSRAAQCAKSISMKKLIDSILDSN